MANSEQRFWGTADFNLKPYDQGEKMQLEAYRAMTPAQRLEQSFRLREMAWSLQKAGFRAQFPTASDEELEMKVRRVFLSANS